MSAKTFDNRSVFVAHDQSEGLSIVALTIRGRATGNACAYLTPKRARKLAADLLSQADAVDAHNAAAFAPKITTEPEATR